MFIQNCPSMVRTVQREINVLNEIKPSSIIGNQLSVELESWNGIKMDQEDLATQATYIDRWSAELRICCSSVLCVYYKATSIQVCD